MKRKRKHISGLERGDQVWLPGVSLRRGWLLYRLPDWRWWSVQVEGELSPQAYRDTELTLHDATQASEIADRDEETGEMK